PIAQQRDDGVLAILRGAADRVERLIAIAIAVGAVPVLHRLANHAADLERLGHQHRRLIGEADALQIAIGIEAGGDGVAEAIEQRGAAPARADVLAYTPGHPAIEAD